MTRCRFLRDMAMAYSAVTVFPADVCAATRTDSPVSCKRYGTPCGQKRSETGSLASYIGASQRIVTQRTLLDEADRRLLEGVELEGVLLGRLVRWRGLWGCMCCMGRRVKRRHSRAQALHNPQTPNPTHTHTLTSGAT